MLPQSVQNRRVPASAIVESKKLNNVVCLWLSESGYVVKIDEVHHVRIVTPLVSPALVSFTFIRQRLTSLAM